MLTSTFSRPIKQPPSTTTIGKDQDPRSYQPATALAAVRRRKKPFSHSSPVKSRTGIFPRRPSSSQSTNKVTVTEAPLFVPEEEDDTVSRVVSESEGEEWEDFDGESEDVQMSIAIAESLEFQHQFRRVVANETWIQSSLPETPIKPPRHTNIDDSGKAVVDNEDDFASPSRLATQLSIAGAKKPLSTRIPSDSARRTAEFSSSIQSVPLRKLSERPTVDVTLDRPPEDLSGDDVAGMSESDEDDDMEEVTIPRESHPPMPPESLRNSEPTTTEESVEPLAIGVQDLVAKRFEEFQKVFAEKRKAFQAENPEIQEEVQGTRASSPGLEYADDRVEVQEREVRSSPPPHSDEDVDMEEARVTVSLHVPRALAEPITQPPGPSILAATGTVSPKRLKENPDEDEEDVPISDWSRSPSPRFRPTTGEAGPSGSVLTLDPSRGLLEADQLFDHGPPGEQDQEHEDFDAAHEMDPDEEAGEFARWISQVKSRNLDDVRKEIEQEINGLRKEQRAAMRDSEDVTGQMIAQIMVSRRDPPRLSLHIILGLDLILYL